MRFDLFDQRGSMIIQVLIAGGLMAGLSLTIASMYAQQNKQIKQMEQKSETIDIKNEILLSLANPHICACNLNPSKLLPAGSGTAIQFNSSPAELDLTANGLRADCEASVDPFLASDKKTQSGLKIDSIKVTSLNRVGVTTDWNGHLEVDFSGSAIKLRKISMPISVESTAVSPFQVHLCRLLPGAIPKALTVDYTSCRSVPDRSSAGNSYWRIQGWTTTVFPNTNFPCDERGAVVVGIDSDDVTNVICCKLQLEY